MMKTKGELYFLYLVIFTGFLAACSNTKYLKEGEALYNGSTVEVIDSNMNRKEKKNLESELNSFTVPKPNTRFLGLRPKLFIYNLAGNPKKENSLRGKLKNKLGEPPVLLSDVDLSYNEKLLDSRLENSGYFHANVSGDTTVKNKRAKATYTATPG
jgi:outer membrane protein insertion porin family